MAKLVRYIGTADTKIVSSEDLAAEGISSPDLVFARNPDYYMSVPDVVAVFLIGMGTEFQVYDGETLTDIFQHNASPEATAEVLGVIVGEGDPQTGVVTVPADGVQNTSTMRSLGTGASQAMPGNDSVRTQAIRRTVFTPMGDVGTGNEMLGTDADGQLAVVKMEDGTALVCIDGEVQSVSFAALEALIETGGGGLALSDLSDVSVVGGQENYVLTQMFDGTFSLRPVPTVVRSVGGARYGSTVVDLEGTSFDVSSNAGATFYGLLPSHSSVPEVTFELPSPEDGQPFFVTMARNVDDPFGSEVPANYSYLVTWPTSGGIVGDTFESLSVFDSLASDSDVAVFEIIPNRASDGTASWSIFRFGGEVTASGGGGGGGDAASTTAEIDGHEVIFGANVEAQLDNIDTAINALGGGAGAADISASPSGHDIATGVNVQVQLDQLDNAVDGLNDAVGGNVPFMRSVEFTWPGQVPEGATNGEFIWRVPYEKMRLIDVRAHFGDYDGARSTASQLQRIDVKKWSGSAWQSIFLNPTTDPPSIASGASSATPKVPTASVGTAQHSEDALFRVDLLNGGAAGAAANKDRNLLVQITFWVLDTSTAPTFT